MLHSGEESAWAHALFHTAFLKARSSGRYDTLAAVRSNFNGSWIGSTAIRMNQLRKEFTVPSEVCLQLGVVGCRASTCGGLLQVSSAFVYATGIGYFELSLNGQAADPSRKLDPGWTTYQKTVLYSTFNVSSLVKVRRLFRSPVALLEDFLAARHQRHWHHVGEWLVLHRAIHRAVSPGRERRLGPRPCAHCVFCVPATHLWASQSAAATEQYGCVALPQWVVLTVLLALLVNLKNGQTMQVYTDPSWMGREGPIVHDSVYNGWVRMHGRGWVFADFACRRNV